MTHRFQTLLKSFLNGPQIAVFAPAIALGAFWFGGEAALLTAALLTPGLLILSSRGASADTMQKSPLQDALAHLGRLQSDCAGSGRKSACFVLALDDPEELTTRHGVASVDRILQDVQTRISTVLRGADRTFRIADNRFAVALAPSTRCTLETGISLSGRLQAAIEAPYHLEGATLYLSTSCGFCLTTKSPEATGTSILEAAQIALEEARGQGGGAIRAFTEAMKNRSLSRNRIADEVQEALENGQIRAWFQPQVSTDTGDVTGFETLVRWEHPERGPLPPTDFLPVIENAGLMPRLTDVMLQETLHGLTTWDRADQTVRQVSVNLAQSELADPQLPDRIRWTLDRFDIPATRLGIEVLEDVVSHNANDVVTRSLADLSKMGCPIDLDDFGTGQTSITSIRRLSISRLKIDRSFITRLNEDQEQQRMVEAILTMAERLDLETVAEGVETVGEYSRVSLLGCTHIQGFAIARPMPLEDTIPWIKRYRAKLAQTPRIEGRKA